MAEATKSAAAHIAQKLGMYELDDITKVKPHQTIMVASTKGIQMGTLKTRTMTNLRYVAYKLNGETLFEERYEFHYKFGKREWDDKPTTNIFLDEEAILYVGE